MTDTKTADAVALEFVQSNRVPFATDSPPYRALIAAIASALEAERVGERKRIIKKLDALPVVINRTVMKRASDHNGWVCAINAAIRSIRATGQQERE